MAPDIPKITFWGKLIFRVKARGTVALNLGAWNLGPRNLLDCFLASEIARQGPDIIDNIPNVIRAFDLAESWHSSETDSVLNDPKQLLVGIALNLLAGEVGCAGIHPSPGRVLPIAIVTVTKRAI